MNPTTLNLLAVSVFAFTLLSLVGPLLNISPGAVAITLSGIAGVFALDRFVAQGKGGNLLIDLVSSQSSDYRQRIVHHEAGHFLVAHLLDVPAESYTLSAWEAIRAGLPGLGGVVLDVSAIAPDVTASEDAATPLSAQQLNRYCIIGMAGIAAESETYGTAEGGQDDRAQLKQLWKQAQKPESGLDTQLRWALLQAQTLLKAQSAAYEALVSAMTERASVAECQTQIEQHRADVDAGAATV
ncbi:MAG: ATP-dependent Zn protease [Cyanobacteria bacterium J06598_1]